MTGQIKLKDGRTLAYAEYGDPAGNPVFYFHGWPGSRLEPLALINTVGNLPVHVIAVDRPGYGLSDFMPDRKIIDWPADIRQLANALDLKRFAVLGVSGGGPYAAACAALLPENVSELLLVCAMGPTNENHMLQGMPSHNRIMLFGARHFPGPARAVAGFFISQMIHRNEFLPPGLVQRLPPEDRRCLDAPGVWQALLNNWNEAFRVGVDGALADGALYAHDWGIALTGIRVPTRLWHGEEDIIVPPGMARYVSSQIPGCISTFLPGEGHFSVPLKVIPEALRKRHSF